MPADLTHEVSNYTLYPCELMKAIISNGESVTLTGKTRDFGHGLQHEVTYQDGSTGYEHIDFNLVRVDKKYAHIKREIEELIFKLLNDESMDMKMTDEADKKIIEHLSAGMNLADEIRCIELDRLNDMD